MRRRIVWIVAAIPMMAITTWLASKQPAANKGPIDKITMTADYYSLPIFVAKRARIFCAERPGRYPARHKYRYASLERVEQGEADFGTTAVFSIAQASFETETRSQSFVDSVG